MVKRMLLAAVLLLTLAALAAAQFDASAVVRVKAGSSLGSGVYLGDRIVLTAAHVFRGETQTAGVWFPDGSAYSGVLKASDEQWDQAVVELNRYPDHPGVRLASENPAAGDTVYAAGYGRGSQVQVIQGRVDAFGTSQPGAASDWFSIAGGAAEGGSSGGPIFNSRGEVIGCLWGSRPQEHVTFAVVAGRTQRFLLPWNARLAEVKARLAQCGPSGCAPPSRQMQPLPRGPSRDVVMAPPGRMTPIPQPATTAPPTTSAPPILQPSIDYDAIADKVLQRMRDDPAPFVGPVGPAGPLGPSGPAGIDGVDGISGMDATLTPELLATMTAAIIQTLKGDQEFLASVKGPQGDPGATPLPDGPQAEWTHLVLVADSQADYWPRLSSELQTATGYYNRLRHIEPPQDRNIGALPVLVAYREGKPVSNWVGHRDVSQALNRIVRGEFDRFILAGNDS